MVVFKPQTGEYTCFAVKIPPGYGCCASLHIAGHCPPCAGRRSIMPDVARITSRTLVPNIQLDCSLVTTIGTPGSAPPRGAAPAGTWCARQAARAGCLTPYHGNDQVALARHRPQAAKRYARQQIIIYCHRAALKMLPQHA